MVLSQSECKRLFSAPWLLKHRFMLSLIYSAGLRMSELKNLRLYDVDRDWMQLHIRQGKYYKDGYVPYFRRATAGMNIRIKASLFNQLFTKNWVAYAKQSFLGPAQIIEYLGRYTHKVAISNELLQIRDQLIALTKHGQSPTISNWLPTIKADFANRCPICKQGVVHIMHFFDSRGPPVAMVRKVNEFVF